MEDADLRRLVGLCEEGVKGFNPVIESLDSYSARFLSDKKISPAHRSFIEEVLYGCVRYKQALKVALTAFYYFNTSKISRSDYTKFLVIVYLTVFRLDDIGFKQYAKIISSQPPEGMVVLLDYFFSRKSLEKGLKDEWINIYDLSYVEDRIINALLSYAEQVEGLRAEVSKQAFGLSQKREELEKKAGIPDVYVKPPTIVKPFKLTQPQPFAVPEPEKISQEVKAKPVPKDLNDTTLQDLQVKQEKKREEIKKKVLKKYQALHQKETFKLHETRDTVSKLKEQQEKAEQQLLSKRFTANPVPDFTGKPANVRLNLSAVLREDCLYKRKQEQEAKLIQAYESELRDSSEFYDWQSKKRQEDEKVKLEKVEERRLSAQASAQAAQLAGEVKLTQKKVNVKQMKAEGEVIKEAHAKAKLCAVEEKQEKARAVKSQRDAPRAAKDQIFQAKLSVTKQMVLEQREREKLQKDKDAQEAARKADQIRQIRALEKVPQTKVKVFDPTAKGEHGLLGELSLIEVRERLAINKKRVEEVEIARREQIKERKVQKQHTVAKRIQSIQRARVLAAEANRALRQEKRKKEESIRVAKDRIRASKQLQLAARLKKIKDKRIEEIRELQEEEDRLEQVRAFLGQEANLVQIKARDELLKGRERETKISHLMKQQAAQRVADLKNKADKLQVLNQERKEANRRSSLAVAEAQLKQQTQEHKQAAYQEFKRKQDIVRKERERYEKSLANFLKRNRYRADILSNVPYRVIYNMSADQLVSFYSAKPNDLGKAVDSLFQGSRIFSPDTAGPDDFRTVDEAARAVHQKLHEIEPGVMERLLSDSVDYK